MIIVKYNCLKPSLVISRRRCLGSAGTNNAACLDAVYFVADETQHLIQRLVALITQAATIRVSRKLFVNDRPIELGLWLTLTMYLKRAVLWIALCDFRLRTCI